MLGDHRGDLYALICGDKPNGPLRSDAQACGAGSGERNGELARKSDLGTNRRRHSANVLDSQADKGGERATGNDGGVLRCSDLSRIGVRSGGKCWEGRAATRCVCARVLIQLEISEMIEMRVTQQNNVYFPKYGICAAGYRVPGIVKDPDPGRIFKEQSAVEGAKLTRALPDGSDLDVLGVGHTRCRCDNKSYECIDEPFLFHCLILLSFFSRCITGTSDSGRMFFGNLVVLIFHLANKISEQNLRCLVQKTFYYIFSCD